MPVHELHSKNDGTQTLFIIFFKILFRYRRDLEREGNPLAEKSPEGEYIFIIIKNRCIDPQQCDAIRWEQLLWVCRLEKL